MTTTDYISNFFSYIKSPSLIVDKQSLTIFQFMKFVLVSYFLLMLMNFLITGPILYLLNLLGLAPQYNLVLPHILIVALVAPIVEELIFRLPLVFRRESVLISITLFLFIISRAILKDYLLAALIAGAGLGMLALIFYHKSLELNEKFRTFERKHYRYIFYFFAISFGLVHIGNFTFSSPWQILAAPLMVIPQLTYGFAFGYMRAVYRWGLFMAIATHMLINLVAGFLRLT